MPRNMILHLTPPQTVCIKYGDKVELNEHVVMNGNIIDWADNIRHLGNLVDATLSDSLDCRYKRSMFIGYVIIIIYIVQYPMYINIRVQWTVHKMAV